MKIKFPKYVKLNNNYGYTTLRRTSVKEKVANYFRDNGQWSLKAKFVGNKLIVQDHAEAPWLSKMVLKEVSKEKWEKDNE